MDKKLFQGLLEGVRQMGAHMRGENVPGSRVTALEDIQPRQIREAAGLSQAEFARLIGVPVKTLQNWEQKRTRPTGPARALLKIVAADPKAAIQALHAFG
ncbi:MAG: helix-turn-helix domain-containing protein [Gammaproteobacteria bacterium]